MIVSGTNCRDDLNECLRVETCNGQGVCNNALGSFTCKCNDGYTGLQCLSYGEASSVGECVGDKSAIKVLVFVVGLLPGSLAAIYFAYQGQKNKL